MGAYIDHAAYYTGELDWYMDFFSQVFAMHVTQVRENPNGLREVWLSGGLQLCETFPAPETDGRCAHLCLLTDDLELARSRALDMGCTPMPKHHWIRLPDGLCIELFQAAPGAVETLRTLPKRG